MRRFKFAVEDLKLSFVLACVLCAMASQASGQAKANARVDATGNTEAANEVAKETARAASYAYEFAQPRFVISRFRIEHDASGNGVITFARRKGEEQNDFTERLTVAPAALARINALLDKLDFINSNVNYQAEKDFSHLGATTLTHARNGRTRTASFNYTSNPDARLLADEYRRMMEQAMFVFDINNARESRSLDSPSIMKRLEILIARNGISDLNQLAPLLRDLSTDERLPLIARNKAEKLLKKAEK